MRQGAAWLAILATFLAQAQEVPTLAAVRKGMGIPSTAGLRGQKDTVGFASTPAQMEAAWAQSTQGPEPEGFGFRVAPGVPGILCPHDDHIYAGRVYRKVVPLVTAKTVVLVGVFHKWRAFAAKDAVVLETYPRWRAPDGPIPVSPLREALKARLQGGDYIESDAMHDIEHSLEAITGWLRHQRADVEILPMLVPMATFPRFEELARRVGKALAESMKAKGWALGKDVAVVISSDGIHYGDDFQHTPFGKGGVKAFLEAAARDRALMTGPLMGPVSAAKAKSFFETVVDPADPGTYRVPWCGRYSVPFGLLLLEATAREMGDPPPVGRPVALSFTVEGPELPLRGVGLGVTAPANLHHFVGIPGVAFEAGTKPPR